MPELGAGPIIPPGNLKQIHQPTLSAEGLMLRPWRADDADLLVRAYQDSDIQRWHVRSMTAEEANTWIQTWNGRWQTEQGAEWAVERDGATVGRIGLNKLNLADGYGEAAYWVLPGERGQNIASRALRSVTSWMFVNLGLNRIELEHSTQNAASCRVAAKCGYLLEGTKLRAGLHADGWHDMHLHARLNDVDER